LKRKPPIKSPSPKAQQSQKIIEIKTVLQSPESGLDQVRNQDFYSQLKRFSVEPKSDIKASNMSTPQ